MEGYAAAINIPLIFSGLGGHTLRASCFWRREETRQGGARRHVLVGYAWIMLGRAGGESSENCRSFVEIDESRQENLGLRESQSGRENVTTSIA